MAYLDGVEGFTPAFTGQQIANQTGSGAASSWSSGMSAGSGRENANTNASQSAFNQKMYLDMKADNENFVNAFDSFRSQQRVGQFNAFDKGASAME